MADQPPTLAYIATFEQAVTDLTLTEGEHYAAKPQLYTQQPRALKETYLINLVRLEQNLRDRRNAVSQVGHNLMPHMQGEGVPPIMHDVGVQGSVPAMGQALRGVYPNYLAHADGLDPVIPILDGIRNTIERRDAASKREAFLQQRSDIQRAFSQAMMYTTHRIHCQCPPGNVEAVERTHKNGPFFGMKFWGCPFWVSHANPGCGFYDFIG